MHTFEKTIRDCQIENERRHFECVWTRAMFTDWLLGLGERVDDLTKQLRDKNDFETIHQEKVLVGANVSLLCRHSSLVEFRSYCGWYATLATKTWYLQSNHRGTWWNHRESQVKHILSVIDRKSNGILFLRKDLNELQRRKQTSKERLYIQQLVISPVFSFRWRLRREFLARSDHRSTKCMYHSIG